jgi:two-component system, chemotaxis family, CheB/CheR fusion protein
LIKTTKLTDNSGIYFLFHNMKKKIAANNSEVSHTEIHKNLSGSKKVQPFPIAAIGASAGGLDALELFFSNMPDNSGLAFVVIQHLDPKHESVMHELLQRVTSMKVYQIYDRLKVKPNHVYVIPPNKNLSILNGELHLFEPVKTHGLRLPIDVFFRSLSSDLDDNSIGIILSGMGSDGSLGIRSIKERNGLVLVQDPDTAKFDSMPINAINAVYADVVASADQLPQKLLNLLKLNPPNQMISKGEQNIKTDIDKVIILIREKTGHDFSNYKRSTILRRIERRKSAHQIAEMVEYVRYLQENPVEVEILFRELLIGVTNFFRDKQVWEKLRDQFMPDLLNSLPDGYIMRAWVTGCSTGEEAFSLAIVFKEALEKMNSDKTLSLQIFATDLDTDAIDKARKGIFPKNITVDVDSDRLSKYFISDGDNYYVHTSIREMIIFASQNVTKDPPFTKLDILTCRNMLIYMESDLQKKLIDLFNFSLNPGGILVLGTAETMENDKGFFEEFDPKLKIYRRTTIPSIAKFSDFSGAFRPILHDTVVTGQISNFNENTQGLVDQLILQRFAPAAVLVNNKGDIIYISGRTGQFLEPVAGKANWNIYAMAREGLRNELPGLFRNAMQDQSPITTKAVKVKDDGNSIYVDVTVEKLEQPKSLKGFIIVIFSIVPEPVYDNAGEMKAGSKQATSREIELEAQLKRSNEEIQSTREEMQTSQEELRSTNEELQSTNEELQSTNEELTTSKEELQSVNEELHSVNAELQNKVSEFLKSNDDMKNLLNSTEIATLFLDKNLNIRRFTDPVTQIFKLRTTDIGRPFTDLVTKLEYNELESHAKQVIKTLTTIETPITTTDGKWYKIRIMPYRTMDDRIDGLVITFNDITDAKLLELELKKANAILKRRE